jgi:hypothetical protein
MKTKIIISAILVVFLFPAVSFADYQANLTVIVNTQGSDSSFHFYLEKSSNC